MELGEVADRRDAALFVGREHELAQLTALLDPDSPHVVGWVCGSPGDGRTALVRELARRATGYDVVQHGEEGWSEVLAATTRPLLVVDPVTGASPHELRQDVLPALPATARVLVVSVDEPGADWWGSVWSGSLLTLRLGPLDRTEAGLLLARRGVTEPDDVAVISAWAQGHPLSLVLAAQARRARGSALGPADLAALGRQVLDLLTAGHLADPALLTAHRLVLSVAALAPGVDADLLDAVLDSTGDEAERWLRGLPFAVRVGTRVTLPARVRALVVAGLRAEDPDLERHLRLALVDHLSASARNGRPRLMLDIREVLDPPEDRGMTASRMRESPWLVDGLRPGDRTGLLASIEHTPERADLLRRWIDRAPEQVVVVRRRTADRPVVGVGVGTSPTTLHPDLADLPQVGAWQQWVLERDPEGPALLTPVLLVLDGEPALDDAERAEVGAALLTAVAERAEAPDFRWWLCPRQQGVPDPAHCGGSAEPSLDLVLDGERVPAFVIDYGPAGVIAAMREQAHRTWAAARAGVTADDVRDALREIHAGGAEPLSDLAHQVLGAVETAFGTGRDGALLRDVVLLGYVLPEASHAHAMRTLHVSRSTYFRRSREAVGILAAWLASGSADRAGTPSRT